MNDQKTILLISPYWKEEHRWMVSSVKLAELWQRLGYRVIGVCMGSESKVERMNDTLTVHYRKDIFLPDPWNYGICFGFFSYVLRLAKQEKPDYIVVNKILFWTSISTIFFALTGRKVILLTDALVGMTWWGRTFAFRIASRIYAWTLGWLIMLSAYKFVLFHPQPESLLKILGVAKKTQIIPTGIDPSLYQVDEDARSSGTDCTITYIGRLESVKGVDDFVAAAVELKKQHPEVKLQVVGHFKEGHPLVEQYRREVLFTGLRHDIPEILAKSDVFVMPSYSEGLSNAIMEAMSSSCACIATAVGGNSYLLQNGVSGLLFTPGDREALLSHLRRVTEDPAKRKQMGLEARKRIDALFSWETVGKQYTALFSEIV